MLENLLLIINFVEADEIDIDTKIQNMILALRYLQGLKVVKWEEIMERLRSANLSKETLGIWEEIRQEAYEEAYEEAVGEVYKKAYSEGRAEGMQEAQEIIASLILHLPDASDETIANLTSKPVELVAQIRREMDNKN